MANTRSADRAPSPRHANHPRGRPREGQLNEPNQDLTPVVENNGDREIIQGSLQPQGDFVTREDLNNIVQQMNATL